MSEESAVESLIWASRPPIPIDHPLPPLFDNECKGCEREMERIPVMIWTKRRPYAMFICDRCKLQLYVFESKYHPPQPLIIWSSECKGTTRFSKRIDEIERTREENRLRREARVKELELAAP